MFVNEPAEAEMGEQLARYGEFESKKPGEELNRPRSRAQQAVGDAMKHRHLALCWVQIVSVENRAIGAANAGDSARKQRLTKSEI